MNQMFVSSQLSDKFPNTIFVKKALRLFFLPLITQLNFKPWIQKSQFPEAIGQNFKLEFGGDGKNGRIRFEGDQGSRMLAATNDFQLLGGMAPCKLHEMDLLISRDLHFEPIGKSIDTFGSDSVKPPEYL